jgi:hypothetical protein
MRHIVCIIGFLVPPLHVVLAQEPLIPAVGSRVRVTTDTRRATGTLESIDGTTIVVRTRNGSTFAFQRASNFDLDVSTGLGSCGEGRRFGCVVLGFLGGAVAGIGVGALAVSQCDDDLCGLLYLVTVPAGALVGTVVGALVGGEHWKAGQLPAVAYVVPEALRGGERRLRLGVQVRF